MIIIYLQALLLQQEQELLWSLPSTPTTTTHPNFTQLFLTSLSSDLSMCGLILIVLEYSLLNL